MLVSELLRKDLKGNILEVEFRVNFRDYVASGVLLFDSKKMNYLMIQVIGKVKEVIESYQGLLNGC